MPSLIYEDPESGELVTFEMHKRITSIGQSDDNDLAVHDASMAETEALVRFDGRTFTLQSIGQSAIEIDGRSRRQHVLEHGDVVKVGQTSFTFRLYNTRTEAGTAPRGEQEETYRSMLELSRKLLSQHALPELLDDIMDSILQLTHADKGFLILQEGEALNVRVARNLGDEEVDEAVNQFSDSIVAEVIRTREPLIVADALNDDTFASSMSVVNLRVCSVMCVPLLDRDELLGLIYVGNDNVVNLFTEGNLHTLTIFAAQVSLIIARAIALDELRLDNLKLQEQLDDFRFGTLIGSCDAMKQVYRRVEKVAATDVSVLVQGETGTGKELIAREIHGRSDRGKGPFVTINCGAIPENLLESELFGHVRGAFTGATANRPGKFQAADGGTLFLDEIGEMPLALQVKILRAIQERTVTRVGDTRPERVDIRIVAATHRDLKAMIAEGTFREDLYYRLNVVALTLPPLRDRGDDIELIARFFLDRFVREFSTGRRTFSRGAVAALKRHSWPGNIRQLENHVKKAVILSESGSIRPEDLDLPTDGQRDVLPLADAREAWQREYILEVLALNDGNRTQTARDLGVDPRTVFRFLEKEQERGDEV